jgi:hypothetical protein
MEVATIFYCLQTSWEAQIAKKKGPRSSDQYVKLSITGREILTTGCGKDSRARA